jgi:hypothetical protein
VTLFSSTLLITIFANAAALMPSWKKNEKRYPTLVDASQNSEPHL